MRSESDAIAASEVPGTVRSLTSDLHALGVASDDVVIVHSSLSSLGWVAGGAQAVVEALLEVVSPAGTIVMPTQSGQLTDPARWSNPPVPPAWVEAVRKALPLYDPRLTPTRSMGQIVECFRHHRDTLRSLHPILSFAANGPAAQRIVGDHPLTPAFGDVSPLGRLYELDAKVLLLGVRHANNTSLHLAEDRATWTGKPRRREGVPGLVNGRPGWIEYDDVAHDETDFELIGERYAESGQQKSGPVGAGRGLLCRQRSLVDFAVEWIENNR